MAHFEEYVYEDLPLDEEEQTTSSHNLSLEDSIELTDALYDWHRGLERSDAVSMEEDLQSQSSFNISIEDSLDISATISGMNRKIIEREDSLLLEEFLRITLCSPGTIKQSKFGTFRYAQAKYGMNVRACEETLSLTEAFIVKVNDGYRQGLDDGLEVFENLERQVDYSLSLEDSLTIAEDVLHQLHFFYSLEDSFPVAESVENQTTVSISDAFDIVAPSFLEFTLREGIYLTTRWKFYIRDSSGNVIASLVNARERWYKEALNHGGSAGFFFDSEGTLCTEDILAINENDLVIKYRGVTVWGGRISAIKKVADGNNIYWEVVAKQFVNLLEKRFCGYNKSTGLSEPREFTTTDAGQIAWTLIDEAQSETYGDLGITQGTIQSSVNRTKSFDRKNIAEAILELAENDYGFDFEITPDKVFNVYYPMKGEIKDDIVFKYPGNCISFESLEDGWDVINHQLGLGKHWGGAELAYVGDDVTSQASYGRRESIEAYKDIELLAYLTSMVDMDIEWNKDIHKVVKFKSFVDSKSELHNYELGDMVRTIAHSFDVDERLYVYERQVSIDDGDTPTVTLTLGD